MKNKLTIAIVIVVILGATGGYYLWTQSHGSESEIKNLVAEFGTKLQLVTLTAPSSTIIQSIKDNYGPYISQGLLEGWEMAPERAPGRISSSPWPDRIEILSIDQDEDGAYDVQGLVIEITSAEVGTKNAASKYPIALKIRNQDGKWVITGFTKAL